FSHFGRRAERFKSAENRSSIVHPEINYVQDSQNFKIPLNYLAKVIRLNKHIISFPKHVEDIDFTIEDGRQKENVRKIYKTKSAFISYARKIMQKLSNFPAPELDHIASPAKISEIFEERWKSEIDLVTREKFKDLNIGRTVADLLGTARDISKTFKPMEEETIEWMKWVNKLELNLRQGLQSSMQKTIEQVDVLASGVTQDSFVANIKKLEFSEDDIKLFIQQHASKEVKNLEKEYSAKLGPLLRSNSQEVKSQQTVMSLKDPVLKEAAVLNHVKELLQKSEGAAAELVNEAFNINKSPKQIMNEMLGVTKIQEDRLIKNIDIAVMNYKKQIKTNDIKMLSSAKDLDDYGDKVMSLNLKDMELRNKLLEAPLISMKSNKLRLFSVNFKRAEYLHEQSTIC
ncbi:hypothetical protein PPACK8108_LOCUS16727, partial [Phakopsora pachyrhizi]